jgi:hypothetical protein
MDFVVGGWQNNKKQRQRQRRRTTLFIGVLVSKVNGRALKEDSRKKKIGFNVMIVYHQNDIS